MAPTVRCRLHGEGQAEELRPFPLAGVSIKFLGLVSLTFM